jgi:hypothetical protein
MSPMMSPNNGVVIPQSVPEYTPNNRGILVPMMYPKCTPTWDPPPKSWGVKGVFVPQLVPEYTPIHWGVLSPMRYPRCTMLIGVHVPRSVPKKHSVKQPRFGGHRSSPVLAPNLGWIRGSLFGVSTSQRIGVYLGSVWGQIDTRAGGQNSPLGEKYIL